MKERLVSLDAFRGITIIGMIIVNTPGSWSYVFPPLRHAEWNGLTPTDLVFPFFLFIVGISIVLAFNNKLKTNTHKKNLVLKILKRSLLIFTLGVFLNLLGSDFNEIRLPGVLQRIAIVFLICSLLFLYTSLKTQVWVGVLLLVGYFIIMITIPVPSFGAGILEPGKNLAAWIDSFSIPFHMYQGTWDPEGLLSTLPAIATGITGMMAGHLIISKQDLNKKLIILFVGGSLAVAMGEIWGWFFPINKNLWSSSYVLYTSGLAAITWAIMIWVMDIKKHISWGKPAIVFGSNAITAYVLSYIIGIPFTHLPLTGESLQELYMNSLINVGILPELVSFSWAIFYTSLCYIPVLFLYKKRIFLKI